MPSVNFTELANSHAVQIVVGTIILVISAWTAKRSITNEIKITHVTDRVDSIEKIVDEVKSDIKELDKTVTNHYKHRFEQIAEVLNIEYNDREEE